MQFNKDKQCFLKTKKKKQKKNKANIPNSVMGKGVGIIKFLQLQRAANRWVFICCSLYNCLHSFFVFFRIHMEKHKHSIFK